MGYLKGYLGGASGYAFGPGPPRRLRPPDSRPEVGEGLADRQHGIRGQKPYQIWFWVQKSLLANRGHKPYHIYIYMVLGPEIHIGSLTGPPKDDD